MKLSKSLAELDAAADELLAKSRKFKVSKAQAEEDELKPEEVSEIAQDTEDEESQDEESQDEESQDEESQDEESQDEKAEKKEKAKAEKKKKAEPEPEEEESEEEESEEEEPEEEEKAESEEIEKSIKSEFMDEGVIRERVNDSEFISAVVDVFSKSLGDMQYEFMTQKKSQSAANEVLTKSLQAVVEANAALQRDNKRLAQKLAKLEKSICNSLDSMRDSLEEFSSRPVGMRKSLASVSVHDRSFDHSLQGQNVNMGFESLNKGQVLDILNNELYSGNQSVTPQDIIAYESGAPLRPQLQSLVSSKCRL